MEVITWKSIPIFTEIIHLLIRKHKSIWSKVKVLSLPYGIVFGHKSDKGLQLGYSMTTNICYWVY